ncbi:hypothetical protein [Actinacidiphila sp. bgisy167]|uniref:hypothetical protein n=1 Tax=Actinacidiphila sp. bgisy167 TaxID=3413797 RepID=UPI003D74EC62
MSAYGYGGFRGSREDQVRRLLDGPHPVVPADLAPRAAERGRRALARRRVLRAVLWTLLVVGVLVAAVLAAVWWPEPRETIPAYW